MTPAEFRHFRRTFHLSVTSLARLLTNKEGDCLSHQAVAFFESKGPVPKDVAEQMYDLECGVNDFIDSEVEAYLDLSRNGVLPGALTIYRDDKDFARNAPADVYERLEGSSALHGYAMGEVHDTLASHGLTLGMSYKDA